MPQRLTHDCTNCGQVADYCAHCGIRLNHDGTKHYNDIVYCAFATPQIDWNDWHTAIRKP